MRSILLSLTMLFASACQSVERTAVKVLDNTDAIAAEPGPLKPTFVGADANRPHIDIALTEIASGLPQLTDLQFPPGADDRFVALQKTGEASVVVVATGDTRPWFSTQVVTVSEQGLLGLAFHPKYAENQKFYVNYTPSGVSPEVSRVAEWTGKLDGTPTETRVVLEVEQPYQNHNAGQLAFGPDGYLYIGWGDGGLRNDPKKHGQNAGTMLGAMLRIDVDNPADGKPYGIPADNPKKQGWLPEVWAIGLRNPWRYSFAPDGRLVIADVGQNKWEEVNIASAGDNLGWVTREGRHCFPPDSSCDQGSLVDPVWEYDHDEGKSITGGYVYSAGEIPSLAGKYVVGDFVAGKMWALDLPADRTKPAKAHALGKWPVLISSFARDAKGNVYVADYGEGRVFRLTPPSAE